MPTFIAARREYEFVDAQGVTIHYYVWNAAKPRAIVQIAHGLGEHAGRYEALAQVLVQNGYTVYADDHRGHGRTGLAQHGGDHSKLGQLGEGGLPATLAGLHQLTGIIQSDHPGVPIVFIGHSWGSVLGQQLVNDHAADFAAVVLTGTAYRTPRHMSAGDLNKRHKTLGTTGYEWLSRDPEIVAEFVADELTFAADARKLFGVLPGVRLYGRPKKPLDADVPLLIMIGEEDSLGGERSVQLLAESYIRRGGLTHVEVNVYEGARHEIFNETNRVEVYADLVHWLDTHLPASS
ncbi:alpha/beta fold hydrolase [Conyzicola sp.]|uniref:alpha/beta fold hydrolase n=1 Tax=Conyzicola sp. TaxID=1969404 RepID=UPI0039899087